MTIMHTETGLAITESADCDCDALARGVAAAGAENPSALCGTASCRVWTVGESEATDELPIKAPMIAVPV